MLIAVLHDKKILIAGFLFLCRDSHEKINIGASKSLGRSWVGLGVVLGWSLSVFGASWGDLGPLLEPLGAVLGGSWGILGRSKIDLKNDPKTLFFSANMLILLLEF